MSEIGGYTPATAKMILGVVRYLQTNGYVITSGQKRPQGNANSAADPPLFFRNDSGEEIPPYACMQVTGTVEFGGQNYFTVDKPADEDASSGSYLFNIHRSVAADEYGNGDAGVEFRAITDGSVSAGDRVSPTTGSWETKKDSAGLFIAGGADDIGDDVFRMFLYPGNGGGGSIIEFEITAAEAVSESTSSSVSGSSSEDSTLCDDRADDAPTFATARVIRRPCGSSSVPGEDGGFVTVYDSAGGFLRERQAAELEGKKGFAAYLSNPDYEEPEVSGSSSGSTSSSSASDIPRCQWVIIWIDWFRWTTGVKDIIFGDNQITVERHNFKVWDECDLEDEVIEGTDCEEDSSSSGSA